MSEIIEIIDNKEFLTNEQIIERAAMEHEAYISAYNLLMREEEAKKEKEKRSLYGDLSTDRRTLAAKALARILDYPI